MMRSFHPVIVAALTLTVPTVASSQSLADRVNGAPDGPVAFSFAARSGVCGNGRTFIETGPNDVSGTFYGGVDETMRTEPCVRGPVRAVIDRAGRLPLSIRTFVGPADTTLRGVTDLGRVSAQQATSYLLSLANGVDGRAGRDAIFPATLADSVDITNGLIGVARNAALPRETRRAALASLGRSGDGRATVPSGITEPILAIARDETDNQSVRQQALAVLSRLDHGAGIPPLIQLAEQTDNRWLQRESMSVLSRSGDPRARQFLRTAVRRTDLPDDVLAVAVRALGQDYATGEDAALLRSVYGTFKSDRAREAALSAAAAIGGAVNTKWLLGLAQDADQSLDTRRRALDAASRSGASIADLVKLYDTTTDPSMKEALVGLYVRNGEPPAVDELLKIIKAEENPSVRRRAISQLSRSDDPRIKQALQDIVGR
jgi:HEAT repeat protein